MSIRKGVSSLAAISLVLGSTAAAAAPVQASRTSSSVSEQEDLAGIGTFGIILGVVVAAAVIAIIASDSDDDPESP